VEQCGALCGDLPYGAPAVFYAPYRSLIAQTNSERPAFSIHVGDFKSGFTPCSNKEFLAQLGDFSLFEKRLLTHPGTTSGPTATGPTMAHMTPWSVWASCDKCFFKAGSLLGNSH
jgi:hypothetical protein